MMEEKALEAALLQAAGMGLIGLEQVTEGALHKLAALHQQGGLHLQSIAEVASCIHELDYEACA